MNFQPDYRHIVNAAYNREAVRLPLYEHIVSADVIGKITGKDFSFLYDGDDNDIREYFRLYCQFFRDYGYDVIPFECCIGQIMPGAGALGNCRITPAIRTRADFDAYPWDEIPDLFFEKNSRYFKAFLKSSRILPATRICAIFRLMMRSSIHSFSKKPDRSAVLSGHAFWRNSKIPTACCASAMILGIKAIPCCRVMISAPTFFLSTGISLTWSMPKGSPSFCIPAAAFSA